LRYPYAFRAHKGTTHFRDVSTKVIPRVHEIKSRQII